MLSDIVVDDERILLVGEADLGSFITNQHTGDIRTKYVGKFFNHRAYQFDTASERTYFLLGWVR